MSAPLGFLDFLLLWCHQQGLGLPLPHRRIAAWLEHCWSADKRELLLLAFRSAGKSTLVGLFCAWLLYRNGDLRILVLAADEALAVKMVRNVKRILERHPATPEARPRVADQWAADRFTVARRRELRDPSMLAAGIAGNVTGSRADVVICDDVEVPNTCDTAEKRALLRERLAEIDFVLVPGGMRLFVGTPHSHDSIYLKGPVEGAESAEGVFLQSFTRLEIPLIDQQGRCAWPERFEQAHIADLRRRSGPLRFASQMLLRPTAISEARLDPGRLHPYEAELDHRRGNGESSLWLLGQRLVSASCWWDVAYGQPGQGDANAIAAVFTDEDGRYHLHDLRYLTHDPLAEEDEATQLCRKVGAFLRDNHLPSVTVEDNGLGRFLPGLLRRTLGEMQVPAAVVGRTSTVAKSRRILEAFDAPLAAGALLAHRRIWETPFIAEMRDWRPERARQRDDGLDAVAGCLLSEPVRLPRLDLPLDAELPSWRRGFIARAAESDFEP